MVRRISGVLVSVMDINTGSEDSTERETAWRWFLETTILETGRDRLEGPGKRLLTSSPLPTENILTTGPTFDKIY